MASGEKIIRIVKNDIEKMAALATKGEVNMAITRGINYAIKRAQTRMKVAVRDEYNLPASAVVTGENNGSITLTKARTNRLCGTVNADISAESLAHFKPTWYKDIISTGGAHKRGGAGGGYDKVSRRGAGYTTTRNTERNTSKSGIYVQIVKAKGVQCIPGAFMIFKSGGPLVMARGKYQGTGKTHDFQFMKPRLPIEKLNSKSVYWGVLHPVSIARWEPETNQEFLDETTRQIALLVK
jgi:hypothetical protein